VLFKRTRSKTKPNKLYIKSYMHKSPNNSLLKCKELRREGPEEVLSSRHIDYKYKLLVFCKEKEKVRNLAVVQY
jgi:hypothetical protein